MNIVLIGGGSFVFAPGVLEDVLVKHRLTDSKLSLVDLNEEAVQAMTESAIRVAQELEINIEIEWTTDRKEVLPGADYVILSASPQGAACWKIDFDILSRLGMPDQARECGGMGGLMNTFRSVSMVMDICGDMEKLCPNAVLLDVTNPMPRVVTAVERYTRIRSIGFCNIAYRGPEYYTFLPALIGKQSNEVEIVTGGLNHFAWLISMKDKQTGEDLMPRITAYIQDGRWESLSHGTQRELQIMRRWFLEYGGIAAGAVDHHAEYLPVAENIHYTTSPPYHGTAEDRKQRLQELKGIASGAIRWDRLFAAEYKSWEHPVDIAVALEQDQSVRADILNIRNAGANAQLPDDRIIEAPVQLGNNDWQPVLLPAFPEKLSALLRQVSDVHEAAAEAAVTGDKQLAKKAIDIDPAITDKEKAYMALEEMLQAHTHLLPRFQN